MVEEVTHASGAILGPVVVAATYDLSVTTSLASETVRKTYDCEIMSVVA